MNFLSDLRVRYGIKMGLAGLLALYLTQVLRLPRDNWATLTVLVMMSAQHVGSVAVKAIMRVIGTVAGTIVGVWLVGNYTSTPVIFLSVFFLVMAISSYKFGQYGARQVPYSYFLLGLTTLTIATNGVSAPDQAWQIGLYRTEEILVGILSALLVSTVLWPRYAREEFEAAGRETLRSVRQLVAAQTEAYARGTEVPAEVEEIRRTFAARLSTLRTLVQAGARESTFFSARISNYNAFLVSLISVFNGALYLAQRRPADVAIVERLRPELERVSAAFSEELSILTAPIRPGEKLRPSSLNNAFTDLEQKISEVREQGLFFHQPVGAGITFGGHFSVLRSLRDELENVRQMKEGLPRFGQPLPESKPKWDLLPTIDWFWVKAAIKGGLGAAVGITLLMWTHPPGPAVIPTTAWVGIISTRPFLRSGGSGDLRIFQDSFFATLVLTGCIIALLLILPFLANYLLMNLTLFGILFTLGFLTARIAGITFWMQLAYLSISTFVGLNPQQPVPSQTVIDSFIGLIVGLVVAALIGRLIWPVLPQTLLRDSLLGFLADAKAFLSGDADSEKILTRLAIQSVEAHQAIRQIRIHGCTKQEKDNLRGLVRELQALAPRVKHLMAARNDIPEPSRPLLQLPFARLETEFIQVLDAFAECFRTGRCRRDLPSLEGALGEMDEAVRQIRDNRVLEAYPVEVALRMLDVVGRYQAIADVLNESERLLSKLNIERYWGDYAL